MSFRQLSTMTSMKISRLSYNVSQDAMRTIPISIDKLSYRALHHKAHGGVSRRGRGRKNHHVISVLNRPNNVALPTLCKSSLVNLKFPTIQEIPQKLFYLKQTRPLSSDNQCVTDEADFDSTLHEREFEMHRHSRGPINRIVKMAKDAMDGTHDKTERDLKVLDIASSPIDPVVTIAKEVPRVALNAISSSRYMLKVMSDKLVEDSLLNVKTELSDLLELSEFDDSSFDLVISCYGVQNSTDPARLINEIHRVLKPGGTVITAIWEHLGTEPIIGRIAEKVFPANTMKTKRINLTKPHELENMIESTGLKVFDISHGEYPLYLSSVDGLHGSAFDLVSIPIKKDIVDLMQSGNRPYAFEDARAEFDDIVKKGNLIMTDSEGRLVVEDNRYKIVVARRQYEDTDRKIDIKKKKESIHDVSKLGLVQPDIEDMKNMINKFNHLLKDTLHRVPNSPWKFLIDSVKQDIKASGHDVSSQVNILDLASYPNEATKMMAKSLPEVNIHCTDLTSDDVKDMEDFITEHQSDHHITTHKISEEGHLKDFDDSSMDIVTCSFGLTRFSDPETILKDIHRVLKPGGSFIATTWDSIALEHIGNRILSGILPKKKQEQLEPQISSTPISNLSLFSTPRMLERLIGSKTNLDITKVDHFEFPFYLGDDNDNAFNTAILSIHHQLTSLKKTGTNPNAFDDARRIYDECLEEGKLVWKDEDGKVWTVRNRYKALIARRKFEDADGILDKTEIDGYNRDHHDNK
jgi:ubiquinone/menaquinone biosynthesis C-methylase UbiE